MAIKKRIILVDETDIVINNSHINKCRCECEDCEEHDNSCDSSSCDSNRSSILIDTSKNYYELNKEAKLEYQKDYYDNHREERIEYQRQYNLLNDDKMKDYQKTYYEKNKEYKLQKLREKVECECGSSISRSGYTAHLKTKLHAKRLASK